MNARVRTLRRLVEAEGKIVEFARKFDLDASYISQLLNGHRGFGERSARKIEQKMGLPEGYFDRTDMESNAEEAPPLAPPRRIPVVGTAQLGDNGYWSELEYPPGHGDGYILLPTRDPSAYALRCRGDSMKPRIRDGEFVVIEPGSRPMPGDEVLVRSKDGRVMVKTLLYVRDGRVHLLSVNEAHPPIAIYEHEIEVIHPVTAICKRTMWIPS
jgi:phage repressor protein C with HTH and peptisase S24 domain